MKVYYALKHAKTSNLMPELGGGYSKWDGESVGVHPPRLFATMADAKRTRTFWTKGEAQTVYSTAADGYGYAVGFEDVGRSVDDLEVVKVGVVPA